MIVSTAFAEAIGVSTLALAQPPTKNDTRTVSPNIDSFEDTINKEAAAVRREFEGRGAVFAIDRLTKCVEAQHDLDRTTNRIETQNAGAFAAALLVELGPKDLESIMEDLTTRWKYALTTPDGTLAHQDSIVKLAYVAELAIRNKKNGDRAVGEAAFALELGFHDPTSLKTKKAFGVVDRARDPIFRRLCEALATAATRGYPLLGMELLSAIRSTNPLSARILQWQMRNGFFGLARELKNAVPTTATGIAEGRLRRLHHFLEGAMAASALAELDFNHRKNYMFSDATIDPVFTAPLTSLKTSIAEAKTYLERYRIPLPG